MKLVNLSKLLERRLAGLRVKYGNDNSNAIAAYAGFLEATLSFALREMDPETVARFVKETDEMISVGNLRDCNATHPGERKS